MIDERIKRVSVVGANGKMGRGIALLLLQEMARSEAQRMGAVGSGQYRLRLIDQDEDGQVGLRQYLGAQLRKYAEKNITALRGWFGPNPELVDNAQIIDAFVEDAINIATFDTSLHAAADAELVFEAIVEDLEVKTRVFKELKAASGGREVYYLTNTSSIPISALDEACRLDHRIIGFHFYNPPPLQRLVEVISSDKTDPALVTLAMELGRRLGKTLVPSHDVAGFIGNGHFIREISFACQKVQELGQTYRQEQAIAMVNQVTELFILRPMGIFQLADYVGLDVCYHIYEVMSEHIADEQFHFALIEAFLQAGVRGGQFSDGSQRDGIFQYQKGRPVAIYNLQKGSYQALEPAAVGSPPLANASWKALSRNANASQKLQEYFGLLFADKSLGSQIAQDYLLRSKQIAQGLVQTGVAEKVEDVNTVLKTGFAHIYGPVNSYY